MTPTFLTAEWLNLVMLNYAVDPALLLPRVPAGTELDFFAGKTWLSLIGFQFNRTRVLGFAIPFHQNFEEVNIRFYVRRGHKRGAVFISELVPKRAVAAVARLAFNENYSRVPMAHTIQPRPDGQIATAEYAWGSGPSRCQMSIETTGEAFLPSEGSGRIHHRALLGLCRAERRRLLRIRGQAPPMACLDALPGRIHRQRRPPLRPRIRPDPRPPA